MKRILSLIVGVLVVVSLTTAQNTFQPKQIDYQNRGIVYNKEFSIDLRLHTNGFALAANIGRIKTYYLTRFYHFEIGEIKSAKEHRQSFDYPSWTNGKTSRSFVFGKQNNFYALRAGIGEKRYFSEKAKKKGLAIGMTYEIGPSLGILKPYYLELIQQRDNSPNRTELVSERYTTENAAKFLDITRIYGSSGFTKGLNELRIIPGGHAQASIHFDWGAFDEFVKALEAGIMVDFYFKKVPIMVENDVIDAENRPFFINLFINLQLGKRW